MGPPGGISSSRARPCAPHRAGVAHRLQDGVLHTPVRNGCRHSFLLGAVLHDLRWRRYSCCPPPDLQKSCSVNSPEAGATGLLTHANSLGIFRLLTGSLGVPLSVRAARQFGLIGNAIFQHKAPQVLILTAIHSKPCIYPKGDHLNFMSVVNKQVCCACEAVHPCTSISPKPPCAWMTQDQSGVLPAADDKSAFPEPAHHREGGHVAPGC